MRKSVLFVALLAVSGLMLPEPARAATIDLTLANSFPNGALGIAYVGPYVASSGGNTIDIICDDFIHDSYVGESWTANVYSLTDNLSQTFFHDQTKYEEAAYLASELLNPSVGCTLSSSNCKGDIQYAVWQLFDSTGANQPFSYISGNDLTNATTFLKDATDKGSANLLSASMFPSFVIYTPISGTATCSGHLCDNTPPQEFITFVPEPGTFELLGLGIAAAALLRRRRNAWSASL